MTVHRWHVTVYLDAFLNLYHASNIIAGLFGLSDAGEICLTIKTPRDGRTSYSGSSLLLLLDTTDPEKGITKKLVLDLYDRSDRFCLRQMSNADYYCKRSFYSPDLENLPAELRAKIRPLGLNYACRRGAFEVLGPLARDYAIRLTRAALANPKQCKKELQALQIRGFLRSPLISDFERTPQFGAAHRILFQTRLWERDEVGPGEDWEEVNEGRVAVVRILKRTFPSQFLGGLVPTQFAKRYYPDLLSSLNTDRRGYIEWSKSASIGIYTRGLHHSQAFKLAEYLAGSKCIVTEAGRNTLPKDLMKGTHFLEFDSAEQCVTQCEALLRDPDRASAMQMENWNYYQAEVRPDVRMKRLLSEVFSSPVPTPGYPPPPDVATASSAA